MSTISNISATMECYYLTILFRGWVVEAWNLIVLRYGKRLKLGFIDTDITANTIIPTGAQMVSTLLVFFMMDIIYSYLK